MRSRGYVRAAYVTTAYVALVLVFGGGVSTGSRATLPVGGLYAQGTARQRGASGTELGPPTAVPPTDVPPPDVPAVCRSCSCSTFLLRTDETLLVGHNLDNGRPVPGTIVVNKRNVDKTGVSLYELLWVAKPPNPALTWTSRYGSVTFNAWGKEFIDGGINEAGLYLHEMSLLETVFPEDETRPRMFMMQWMQYQLDNYATVEQVLSNLSSIVPDGWYWHFFVSDREGNAAAIEFVDGEVYAYSGDTMPVPVLCNRAYPDELANLQRYAGFGGEQRVRLRNKRTERFVHAAYLIQNAPPSADAAYGFEMLETLERGLTHWSIVIDVNQGRVYFRTSLGKQIKYVDLARFDFSSDTPVQMLDINAPLSGDVLDYFVDYSPQRNLRAAREGIESTDSVEQGLTRSMEPYGLTLEGMIERACAAAHGGSCAAAPAGAEAAGGEAAIAADALSKPGPTRNWLLWPLGAVLALLLSVSLWRVHRNRRRPPPASPASIGS